MKRFIKATVLVCLLCILVATATGCGYIGYRGDYLGAYTLIYNQIPDILGARDCVPLLNPQILVLERDQQGRVLYLYLEDTDDRLSIGIVQKESAERVYFYPEQATLSFNMPDRFYDISNKKLSEEALRSLLKELCPTPKMDQFKQDNDWDLPLDESKLDSAPIKSFIIVGRWENRTDGVNLSDDLWKEQMVSLALKNGHNLNEEDEDCINFSYARWMATDHYGRRLYYVESYYYEYPEDEGYISNIKHFLEMVAIINPNGTFDQEQFMVEIADMTNYQDTICELKLANNWNQPLE